MRLTLTRPAPEQLQAIARAAADRLPDYAPIGGTLALPLPQAVFSGHDEVVLGRGEPTWTAACAAMDARAMFDLPWLATPSRLSTELHGTLVYASRVGPLWSLNTCRIVATEDHVDADLRRRSFAHGTIAPHGVRGEERFSVSWSTHDDLIRFAITQFSWPSHWLVGLAGPWVRRIQRRFVRDASAAMAHAVEERVGRATG